MPGEVLVEGVLDLLVVEASGASKHQARQESSRHDLALQAFRGAVVQVEVHVDGIATRFLGDQCELHASIGSGRWTRASMARGDMSNDSPLGLDLAALVVLEQLGHVGSGGRTSARACLGIK